MKKNRESGWGGEEEDLFNRIRQIACIGGGCNDILYNRLYKVAGNWHFPLSLQIITNHDPAVMLVTWGKGSPAHSSRVWRRGRRLGGGETENKVRDISLFDRAHVPLTNMLIQCQLSAFVLKTS